MIRIVCYGDSNTFGAAPSQQAPGIEPAGRYPDGVRWTSRLQEILGKDYHIIEAGLGGRTTVFDDPIEPDRNGLASLRCVFQMNNPVDLFIFMLGTNDAKDCFAASAGIIARGMERLVKELKVLIDNSLNKKAKILVVSPIAIRPARSGNFLYDFSETSARKVEELAEYYKALAVRQEVEFWNASLYVAPGEADGVHMDEEAQEVFANAIAEQIKHVLG